MSGGLGGRWVGGGEEQQKGELRRGGWASWRRRRSAWRVAGCELVVGGAVTTVRGRVIDDETITAEAMEGVVAGGAGWMSQSEAE